MSVLLVEVLANEHLCNLADTSAFDKVLLLVDEDLNLSPTLKLEYAQVYNCADFITRTAKKSFLRTSGDLHRGIIAGTLNAVYQISIRSEREESYESIFKAVYSPIERPSHEEPLRPPLTPAPKLSQNPQPEVSEIVYQKLFNIYFYGNGMLKALKSKIQPPTSAELIELLIKVLNQPTGNPITKKVETARSMFDILKGAGYFKLNGDAMIYDEKLYQNKNFKLTGEQLQILRNPDIQPREGLTATDMDLYLYVCNQFLNIYLASPSLRSLDPVVVQQAIRAYLYERTTVDKARALSQAVFDSFSAAGYFTVTLSGVQYNPSLCRTSKLTHETAPRSAFSQNETALAICQGPVTRQIEELKDEGLPHHIANIILMVKSSNYLSTCLQIRDQIQKSLLQYQKEKLLAFESEEIETICYTVLEFLRERGYNTTS